LASTFRVQIPLAKVRIFLTDYPQSYVKQYSWQMLLSTASPDVQTNTKKSLQTQNGFEGKSMVLLFRRAKSPHQKHRFFYLAGGKTILFFRF